MASRIGQPAVVRPRTNESLRRWITRRLRPDQEEMTAELVGYSLGRQAKHAFEFEGNALLMDFLEDYGSRSADHRSFVVVGVNELATNLDRHPARHSRGGRRRLDELLSSTDGSHREGAAGIPASSVECTSPTVEPTEATRPKQELPAPPTALRDATKAARHFYLFSRAALERTSFVSREQAADIACFETFRLASMATNADNMTSVNETTLLAHILNWHQDRTPSGRAYRPAAMLEGVALVASSVQSLKTHSMAFRLAESNATVSERLGALAIRLLSLAVGLDGVNAVEDRSFDDTLVDDGEDDSVTRDLALAGTSVFVGVRNQALRRDEEFDELWALYQRSVPWTSPIQF